MLYPRTRPLIADPVTLPATPVEQTIAGQVAAAVADAVAQIVTTKSDQPSDPMPTIGSSIDAEGG